MDKLPLEVRNISPLIDLHNMSIPSVPVDENDLRLFDAINKTVGKPFSRDREFEAIRKTSGILPCTFCLRTNQGNAKAYRHSYSDGNGKVSCYLVLDFINKIHEQHQNSVSKERIESLLRLTLESSSRSESLGSTWPLCSESSSLNPNNLNLLLNGIMSTGQFSHSTSQNYPRYPLHQITPRQNYFRCADEKVDKLAIQQTEASLSLMVNQMNNSKFSYPVDRSLTAFDQQNSKFHHNNSTLGQTFCRSDNSEDIKSFFNFLNSPSDFNRSSTMNSDIIKENLLKNSAIKGENEHIIPFELDNSNNHSDMGDNLSIPNSGSFSEDSPMLYLQNLSVCADKSQVSIFEDSGVNDIAYLKDVSF